MSDPTDPAQPPPRAFTQGVGTVFQFVGVTIFVIFFFICCLSGLLSKDTATQAQFSSLKWHDYTAQRAITISLVVVIFLGMALAGIGLGLQAQNRRSPLLALAACGLALIFFLVHIFFFAFVMHSIVLTFITLVLTIVFAVLFFLSIAAVREMQRTPPPSNQEILPADYKIPYSHLHQDPPEIRLARELDDRRKKLEIQQKELEMLEQKLHEKLKDKKSDR